MAIQNISFSYAFLQPLWFIMIFGGVIFLEGLIYYLTIKNKRKAIQIAFIGNVITTFVPIPILLFPIFSRTAIMWYEQGIAVGGLDYYSLWLIPVLFGFTLVKPLPTIPPFKYSVSFDNYLWTFILFTTAFVLSIIIEYFYYKSIKLNSVELVETKLTKFQQVCLANLISYSMILLGLIAIGLLVGLSKESDPLVGVSWLFFTLNADNFNLFLITILFFLVSLIFGYLIIFKNNKLKDIKALYQKN